MPQVIIGPGDLVDMRQPRSKCLDAIHRAKKEFGNTDIYNIYEKKCRYDSKCAAGTWRRLQVLEGLRRIALGCLCRSYGP